MNRYIIKIARLLSLLILLMVAKMPGVAFPLNTYASKSVLSDGRWVKITVADNGVYGLSRATLRSMGFNNPEQVRIYGYGAPVKNDRLAHTTYRDDLPMVQSVTRPDGTVVFYGQSYYQWRMSQSGYFTAENNLYATKGVYYVTEVADSVANRPMNTTGRAGAQVTLVHDTYWERVHHEVDLVSPGESGAQLVGEDFKFTPSRTFNFNLPGIVENPEGENAWMEISFVARTLGQSSIIDVTANGIKLPMVGGDRIASTANDEHYHGQEGIGRRRLTLSGEKLALGIKHSSPVSVHGAWLNYITINYLRRQQMPSTGYLTIYNNGVSYGARRLSGVGTGGVHVWDVTDPENVKTVNVSEVMDGAVTWTPDNNNIATYVAWTDNARLPEPVVEGVVANQDLHSHQGVNMVIVTLPQFKTQANRLAELHRKEQPDSLTVTVVDANEIYNEFGSGTGDPWAIRAYLKMIYDRAKVEGSPLRYVLLMGDITYDTRFKTEGGAKYASTTLPTWYSSMMSHALSDNVGYPGDDFFSMLEDNSAYDMAYDDLNVAVGRIPVSSARQAQENVDKILNYVNSMPNNEWHNKVMIVADDQDSSQHLKQAESLESYLNPESAPRYVINKIYLDAYDLVNGSFPLAREEMFKNLDDGTMLWIYLGHANPTSWGHEHQLTYNDINNRLYYKAWPFVFAGTCDFQRWDSREECGAEIMYHNTRGGVIGMISATRPVYITENGKFTAAIGRSFANLGSSPTMQRVGDFYREAKNDIRNSDNKHESNSNRLRYALMGDPALKIAMPYNRVNLLSIDGVDVSADSGEDGEQAVVKALQPAVFSGNVSDADGNALTDFDGLLTLSIYDATYTTETQGHGEQGNKDLYDRHGGKLYTGVAEVKGGQWKTTVNMPFEISQNFRPAFAGMYAYSTSTPAVEASGANNRFYVYGYHTPEVPDTIAPDIDMFVLNHSSFVDGGVVNATPTVLARVSDNIGINISTAGIGHQMTLTLDGKKTYNNVVSYWQPSSDGSPQGTITYPMDELTEGPHTLKLRVWDTSGNSAAAEISFVVSANMAPTIYDVWTDANPATTTAGFYVSHNRPDQTATVSITVYNLNGSPVWTGTSTGPADMFTSSPVVWDLTDNAGHRVERGIYLYRAAITTDGVTYSTASKRIAVAAE
ncbi:MAG: type IX secretion system sortase PorU [Muribaculaceae bacterium]|nr:type IX secretion system sortase PorU [Muribaculaceae bacterium]